RHKFENLNEIPAPDYDLETNYILEKNGNFSKLNESHIGKWIFYHGIRGCIYTCRFCCNNSLDKIYEGKGAKIRKKSIQLVIKELQDLIKKFPKVERIWFTDDDVNMRTVEELQEFRRLYKENIGLPFQCYMSPTTVTETKLKLLIETGLKQIEFGVQTGSDRVNREIYGRPIFKKAVLRAAEIVNKYKKFIDSVNFQFITTNPYESKEDILETINLIRKFPSPFMIQAYGLVFFPGSPMYYKAISDGYIEKFDDSGYDVDFLNYQKHVKLKNKNTYLNSMIHMMGTNSTSFRNGLIPRFAFKYLLKDEVIEFFENKPKLIKFINSAVEKIRGSYIAEIVHYPNKIKGLVYSIVPKKVKEPIKKALKLDIYSKDYIPVTIEFEATETDKEQNLQSSQPTLKILNNPN
ncbi:MAG: B12-binding domain-containing radical SAM protein, partial [Candidatus Nanoarchaeia archaeon]